MFRRALRTTVIAVLATFSLAAQPTQAAEPSTPALPASSSAQYQRPVSLKKLFPNLGSDQKRIWTSPLRFHKNGNWIPVAVVVGTTAGLIAMDPRAGRYFRRTTTFDGFNRIFTSGATQTATLATPGVFYLGGLLSGDAKMRDTGLLAAQALGNAVIVSSVIKSVSRRARPIDLPEDDPLTNTFFASDASFLSLRGGFPSGHTISAFAVATVIARRYGNHRWVPFVAYGAAVAIGFSRVTQSAHFPADIFIGGALGYSISRYAVLRH